MGEPQGTLVGDSEVVRGMFSAETCFLRALRGVIFEGEAGGEPGEPRRAGEECDNKVFENTLA